MKSMNVITCVNVIEMKFDWNKIIWMRGKSTRHCLVINTRIIRTEEIK